MDKLEDLTFPYRNLIEDTERATFLFRKIRHLAIRKPRKRRKNSQYSTPYKRNYPYWKGYPYDKDGFDISKPDIDGNELNFFGGG